MNIRRFDSQSSTETQTLKKKLNCLVNQMAAGALSILTNHISEVLFAVEELGAHPK
jgi:hypothetical protein